ncbi:response regulator [bacterium]|nr:response regulator [bacterium]
MKNSDVKILMVEDDDSLGSILREYLLLKGYNVTHAKDGLEALDWFARDKFDICLLDVMMPKLDGFNVARKIREEENYTPIIFVTAKSMQADKLEGLKIGADDYVTKPFSMEELQLRIEAILRRFSQSEGGKPLDMKEYKIGKFRFNRLLKILTDEKGAEKGLTDKEAALLEMLIQHKNDTMSRKEALIKIWGDDDYFNGRSMDVYITKIRKMLRSDSNLKLNNVHGVGYQLIELKDDK